MFPLLLAVLLQVSSGDVSFPQAEAYARRDEATLTDGPSSEFFTKRGEAVRNALVECGVRNVRQMAGVTVVLKLDAQGRVTRTWLNESTSLGQCFASQLELSLLPTDGRPEFYTLVDYNEFF